MVQVGEKGHGADLQGTDLALQAHPPNTLLRQSAQCPQELPFRFTAKGGRSLAGFLSKNPLGFSRKPM